jgi:hypothetical protein
MLGAEMEKIPAFISRYRHVKYLNFGIFSSKPDCIKCEGKIKQFYASTFPL